tara:strand:+ start:3291 stop:3764 length:474 start_codon:yes stop_codon:yes gene_type:complete
MGLDIATPKGRVSLKDEQIVARWFNYKEGHCYLQTPKDSPAKVDAVLARGDAVIGLAETKCRYNITLQDFRHKFHNEWLVTWEKLESGLKMAEQLCVPLYGFLYLVDDDVLLIANLSKVEIRREFTETQKTINGGKIVRENGFIPMKNALVKHDINK